MSLQSTARVSGLVGEPGVETEKMLSPGFHFMARPITKSALCCVRRACDYTRRSSEHCLTVFCFILPLSVQVLQALVSGRTVSKPSYFLRQCRNSPEKVANSGSQAA